MKRSHIFILISSLLLLTTSCTRYVVPSMLGNNVPYKQKPMVADSIASIISIEAGIANSAGKLFNEGTTTLGYLNINRGHTYKNINFSYGLYSYLGKVVKKDYEAPINDKYVYLDNFSKATSAIGMHSTIGFHTASKRGNTDFRIINWENTISREFGDFLNFRKQLYGDLTYRYLLISNSEVLWTTGVSSEIIFHPRNNKDFKHAFKLFVGGSPHLSKSFDNALKNGSSSDQDRTEDHIVNLQFTYFLKFKNFNLTYQTDLGSFSMGFGLGYSF